MKYFDTENDVTYQLVPPDMHWSNAAERCIWTFNNHLMSEPSSTDNRSPLHLWDRLIPQETITLNMLRPLRRNPKMSAHMELEGAFEYNKTPLAPPGTKVVVHKKYNKRASWAAHGLDGWYLGPEMDHYCCYRVYVTNTRAKCNSNTVDFFTAEHQGTRYSRHRRSHNRRPKIVTAL